MTRLTPDNMKSVESTLAQYDRELEAKTGMDLVALAETACRLPADTLRRGLAGRSAAVIPITAGQGVIGGFSRSVAVILRQMGLTVRVTGASDVDGLYEACREQAELVFLADDSRYAAFHLKSGLAADNSEATALGYVAALEGMTGSLAGKKVLLLGAGTVGMHALAALKQRGAAVFILERQADRLQRAVQQGAARLTDAASETLRQFSLIFDATSQGGWLREEMLRDDVRISMPGLPCSLQASLYQKYQDRIVHDPLQIGTATMLGMLFAGTTA